MATQITRYQLGSRGSDTATVKYSSRFFAHLYNAATKGKSTEYANALIDDALALCGSPFHKLSRRHWGEKALLFLDPFTV